jgi:integrase/recombinase XerD
VIVDNVAYLGHAIEHMFASLVGGGVFVQRVLMPVTDAESWTLLGDDGAVVEPADQYLAYLTAIERSPNTVRAYAVSLKLWFEFLSRAGLDWKQAGVEDVARFVGWLRAPAENVIVLGDGSGARAAATVNRYLAGVFRLLRPSRPQRRRGGRQPTARS